MGGEFNFSAKRKHIALKYDNIFAQSKLIQSFERDYDDVVPHIYVVKILKMQNRDFVIKEMKKKGVWCLVFYLHIDMNKTKLRRVKSSTYYIVLILRVTTYVCDDVMTCGPQPPTQARPAHNG